MKELTITWQRLVDATGSTCPRCAGTQEEVQQAVDRLRAALEPLGVRPVLEMREIDPATFLQQPDQSNRIWVGGRPLEDWLGARSGSSPCCDACGDAECRTLEIDGTSHEVVPEALLVRAGLIAASQLFDPTLSTPDTTRGHK
jgi:anti-sigma factor RsiW